MSTRIGIVGTRCRPIAAALAIPSRLEAAPTWKFLVWKAAPTWKIASNRDMEESFPRGPDHHVGPASMRRHYFPVGAASSRDGGKPSSSTVPVEIPPELRPCHRIPFRGGPAPGNSLSFLLIYLLERTFSRQSVARGGPNGRSSRTVRVWAP